MSKNDYVLAIRTYSIKGYRRRKRSALGNMFIFISVIGALSTAAAAMIHFIF